jgi:hypothetical protein
MSDSIWIAGSVPGTQEPQRKPKNQARPECAVGDYVTLNGSTAKYRVTSVEDPSLIGLLSEYGVKLRAGISVISKCS